MGSDDRVKVMRKMVVQRSAFFERHDCPCPSSVLCVHSETNTKHFCARLKKKTDSRSEATAVGL